MINQAWLAACCLVLAGGSSTGSVAGALVRFTTIEADSGQPVPCRIHLTNDRGQAVRAPSLPFWHDHFVCAGTVELELAPGKYAYEIERGPEYRATAGQLTVAVAGAPVLTNRLHRIVDLSRQGWWSGDLHVHRQPADMPLLMRAEDLHVAPVITWWNTQNLWRNEPLPTPPLIQFDGNRFYHLLGGEDERGGGALLYFNLDQPLDFSVAKREYPSPMQFLSQARQQPRGWVDIEKPFWYDVPVWLASGQVDSIGIAHNHMQRGGVMANEAWGRPRDRQRLPDPQGNGYWTQEIYYHLLNCGLRLPPSAGSASGVLANPVGYDRAYVHLDGELSYEKWWEGLRAGRVFVSNGPLLRCQANGQFPGHLFTAEAGRSLALNLQATVDARDPISRLEIIQNGRVLRAIRYAEWKQTGSLGTVTFRESGWFLLRVIADVPQTFRFASTGPFYVEIGPGSRRVSRASAQFFLDWVRERQGQIKLETSAEREAVLKFHRAAEEFWRDKVAHANTD